MKKDNKNYVNPVDMTKTTNKFVDRFRPYYQKIDIKFAKFIPNPKLRKILLITILGFVILFFLILILGVIATSKRPKVDTKYTLNKPAITNTTPVSDKPKTPTQKKLNDLKLKLDSLNFPPSTLNIPQIKTEIEIKQ